MPAMDAIGAAPAAIDALLADMSRAWAAGDADGFAACFAAHARFVAFDGTVLTGPAAIAAFHAGPFRTYLAGSELVYHERTAQPLGGDLWLVASLGGINKDGQSRGDLTGLSAQSFVIRTAPGPTRIEVFQNTRVRPITGPAAADLWREFDRAWFAHERRSG